MAPEIGHSRRHYSVYKTAVRETADLKQRLIETWSSIQQTVIDEAIDEWGTTTTSLRQGKGTSLRALAVTNLFFSETPTFYRRK